MTYFNAAMSYQPNSAKRDSEQSFMDNGHISKKPRFDVRNPSALAPDAPEDDVTLDADVIGGRGQKIRRGAVNIDGYESDSDNENFDTRAATRTKNDQSTKVMEEDENDMFADLEAEVGDNDDNERDLGGKKKKGVKFLEEDDIEGQVRSSKSGGHVSADFSMDGKGKGHDRDEASDDESEDDDDAPGARNEEVDEEVGAGGKKVHAPKLDAFNMRNENEEGRFDEHGNYVRKAIDPDAVHDVWLEGISKKEMKKASEAHDKREKERREKAIQDDSKSDGDLLSLLLALLQPTETVLEALARLNKTKAKKGKWPTRTKKKGSHAEGAGETSATASAEGKAEEERGKAIVTITEAADLLLARGQAEIYYTEKELLIRRYRQATGEEWTESSSNETGNTTTEQWQYRWSDGRDGGGTHGPYDTATMKAWIDAGYFDENVEYRKSESGSWIRNSKLT